MLFYLWEKDGYMRDVRCPLHGSLSTCRSSPRNQSYCCRQDRDVHDLAFLYAKSLYDIRQRSESLLSTCSSFMTATSSRIDWILRLEQYRTAFEICDSSGDGRISKEELTHLLARITFDSGTAAGHKCQCATCVDWSNCVTTTGIDWGKFRANFDAVDTDNSGELDFCEGRA